MRKVLLSSPCLTGQTEAHYATSLYHTGQLLLSKGIQAVPILPSYESTLVVARNDLVKLAVEGQFDDMIWIDVDQEWIPTWVLELLEYPVDVVGAPIVKKTLAEENYNVRAVDVLEYDAKLGLWRVDYIGCGLTRWSKKAFTKLYSNSPMYFKDGKPNHMCFELQVNEDKQLVSEDNTACIRWGGPVYVAAHMNPGHIGPFMFKGNFEPFVRAVVKARQSKEKTVS